MSTSYLPANAAGERIWATSRPRRPQWRRILPALAAAAALFAAGTWMYQYRTVGRYLLSSRDAYVTADFVRLSAPVGGVLTRRIAGGTAHVRKGDILATIDGRPVVSTVDGTINGALATAGERIARGAPLFSIAPAGKAYVVAAFDAAGIGALGIGEPVAIRVHGFPQFRLQGVVASLPEMRRNGVAVSDRPARNLRQTVRIDLEGPASSMDWLLGLPVRATVDTRPGVAGR